jgi:acetyl-CoA synthetase
MRRILKELVCTGEVTGNITTLEDYTVVATLQRNIAR